MYIFFFFLFWCFLTNVLGSELVVKPLKVTCSAQTCWTTFLILGPVLFYLFQVVLGAWSSLIWTMVWFWMNPLWPNCLVCFIKTLFFCGRWWIAHLLFMFREFLGFFLGFVWIVPHQFCLIGCSQKFYLSECLSNPQCSKNKGKKKRNRK